MDKMRLPILAMMLCGCGADHFGTYFIADGTNAQIDFDHAEFFFGSQTDGSYASPLGASAGRVFRRLFVPSDAAVAASANRTATYYLPSGSSTSVGNYVLAVGRNAADAVVGVADASDFPLANGEEVIKVQLDLVPPDSNVEIWGVNATCAAWTRAGSPNVAVVQEDDRDCDGAEVRDDCNDLAFCAPGDPGCSTEPSLCESPCAVGCRSNDACEPALCLPASTCALPDGCKNASTLAERIACVAEGAVQLTAVVPLMDDGRPCADSFSIALPGGTECARPVIEYGQLTADGYTFRIQDDGTSCKVEIKAPSTPGALDDHHLLVSIDAPSGIGPRLTFLLGVKGIRSQPGAGCASSVVTEGQLELNSCR